MATTCVSWGTLLVQRMARKKLIDVEDTNTELNRCLGAKRLTFVGIGSMVGAGIYVLVGVAAKNLAGPAVIISFLLAAFCICLTSFCFAEFASRIPKSGNPYLYIYVTYGEFVAFLIGWGFIVSYITSGSLSARAWSGYVDSMLDNAIKNYTLKHVWWMNVGDPISQYPDFVAFAIQFIIIFIAATGAHCSSTVNGILTGFNVGVLVLVMIMGAMYGDVKNWHNVEHGGFFPFGIDGVMQGTSACFYAFFGFETVCIAAEEAKDPSKSVPRGLIVSIVITTLLYVGTATAFTLLVPFWLVNERAPLSSAFDHAGPSWMKYIVSVGPLFGFTNILLLNTYGFSRLCFSLAEEGLLFKACSKVSKRTKVPLLSLLLGGLAMCVGAMCLDLENLFRFNVISAILPFALVSFGVIILRYDPKYNKLKLEPSGDRKFVDENKGRELDSEGTSLKISTGTGFKHCRQKFKYEVNFLVRCFGIRMYILIIFFSTALLSAMILFGGENLSYLSPSSVFTITLLTALIVASICAISSQDKPEPISHFKVPLVPLFPIVSGILNVFFLVAAVDKGSAIGYSVVVVLGIIVYLGICICDIRNRPDPMTMKRSSVSEMEHLLDDTDET